MSEIQIILQLTRIEKMLRVQTLLNKEVLTTREAAIYPGLSRDYMSSEQEKMAILNPERG